MTKTLEQTIGIAHHAGAILFKYYKTDLDVEYKSSKFDPVTVADREADDYIRNAIKKLFPNDEILSEESSIRPGSYSGRVWAVDPLDGTKDFVHGEDCFSVIIGLLENGKPTLGVVYVPARGTLYFAEHGRGAFVRTESGTKGIKIDYRGGVAGARHLSRHKRSGDVRPIEEKINKLPFKEQIPEGSIGTKVCMIADGSAEAFIHTNTGSNKWDTAGCEIILSEAGGVMTDLSGRSLDYKQQDVNWSNYLVAAANQKILDQIIEALN